MEQLIAPVAVVSLVIFMLGLGMELRVGDFVATIRRPKSVIVGLTMQVLGLPLIAFSVCQWLQLDGVIAAGMMTIAASPSGASSNMFTWLAKGDLALAVTLTILTSVVSIISAPVVVNLSLNHFLHHDADIALPFWSSVMKTFLITVAPLAVGIALCQRAPGLSQRWHARLKKLAVLLLVFLVFILTFEKFGQIVSSWSTIVLPVIGQMIGAIALAACACLLFQLPRTQLSAVCFEVCIHNSIQAVFLITLVQGVDHATMSLPAAIYAIMMYFGAGALLYVLKKSANKCKLA